MGLLLGCCVLSEMSARHMSAGPGLDRVSSLRRTFRADRACPRRRTGPEGASPGRSGGGAVRDEHLGQGVVRRGLTCVAAPVLGRRDPADVECGGTVVRGGVDV